MKAQSTKPLHTRVLIVGGGITGLSATLFLLKQGITPLLIERHQTTSVHPRARGFDTRTMELLRELELSGRVREAGKALGPSWGILTDKSLTAAMAKRKPKKQEGIHFPSQMKGLKSLAALSPETGARCTQDLAEPVLLEAAKSRGADVRFYTELLSFSQHDQGITAVIRDRETGEQRMVYAGYMIAADGAGSSIRETLQVPSEGKGALGNLLNIYFEADLAAWVKGKEFSILRINEPGIKGFLSAINNSDRWTFQLHYDPEKEKFPEDINEARVTSVLQEIIGIPGLNIRIISILPWQPTVKVADSMQHGKIFLAGDAAHVMTPYGGKGANTGIQDVHNLAWKLAAVLRGKATPALLQTYDAERRPVGWYHATRSGEMADRYGLLKKPTFRFILPFLSVMAVNRLHLRRLFPKILLLRLGYLLGLPDYQYVSPAIISENKPLHGLVKTGLLNGAPGTRMPHIWLKWQGKKCSTLDLLGTDFVLFTGADNNILWKRIADIAGDKFDIKIPVYGIGKAGTPIFADTETGKSLGISDNGAVLARPDGFVGWRSHTCDAGSLAALEKGIAQILSQGINGQRKQTKVEEASR